MRQIRLLHHLSWLNANLTAVRLIFLIGNSDELFLISHPSCAKEVILVDQVVRRMMEDIDAKKRHNEQIICSLNKQRDTSMKTFKCTNKDSDVLHTKQSSSVWMLKLNNINKETPLSLAYQRTTGSQINARNECKDDSQNTNGSRGRLPNQMPKKPGNQSGKQ